MIKHTTYSDMGNIKVFNKELSCFFDNGFGDGKNNVYIYPKGTKKRQDNFLGHFTVVTKAHLSEYDCNLDSIYTFSKGRWFVFLKSPCNFIITKVDEDVHA
jgi:hypothetical protein